MEIIVGKTAGFCFGVSNAVDKAKQALRENKSVSCLGELVHNDDVTNQLKKEGLQFVDNIEQANGSIIIRAHGEPITTYEKANELKLKIIDLTCPKVLKIHNIVKEYVENEYYIFLIGQKRHPETIGTISYCGVNADIIENENDIDNAVIRFNNSKLNKLLIISQTTFSMENFEKIQNIIRKKINQDIKLEIKNTICDATKIRQEETMKIAKEVDLMIIIGGKHSSNTNKLYQIACLYCDKCFLIENDKELNIDLLKTVNKIGIIAGASTPQKSIETVVEKLKGI